MKFPRVFHENAAMEQFIDLGLSDNPERRLDIKPVDVRRALSDFQTHTYVNVEALTEDLTLWALIGIPALSRFNLWEECYKSALMVFNFEGAKIANYIRIFCIYYAAWSTVNLHTSQEGIETYVLMTNSFLKERSEAVQVVAFGKQLLESIIMENILIKNEKVRKSSTIGCVPRCRRRI